MIGCHSMVARERMLNKDYIFHSVFPVCGML